LLISVHLPKTAGASFRASLKAHFGDKLVWDYSDRPINQAPLARKMDALKASFQLAYSYRDTGTACIHGHFLPVKYRWARTPERKQFVVWLRDPIERLASNYYYWTRDYDPKTAGKLRRRIVEENWSLERFCFSSEMKNTYTKFFWGFPMDFFDFVGITENYETDLSFFAKKVLKSELAVTETNVNLQKENDLYIGDKNLRSRLERFHQKDMRLYWKALKVSNNRE
jgi:hypothetical protein